MKRVKKNQLIYDQYISLQKKYQGIYGKKTIVLMEVGAFYEIYGLDNKIEKTGLVREMSMLLNIAMTRKNKQVLENSRKNPLMAGITTGSLQKYLRILLKNEYTVILVKQVGEKSPFKRKVMDIISPGTYIDEQYSVETNWIVSIYIEQSKQYQTGFNIYSAGMSIMDASTGENYIYNCESSSSDTKYAIDEIYRILQIYKPKEVILSTENITGFTLENLINHLELNSTMLYSNFNNIKKEFKTLSYQNKFLEKIFPKTGFLSVIEYLDLEFKNNALLSYIFLLQFIYEHNETILLDLNKPKSLSNSTYMILANDCIRQLNVVPNSSIDSRYDSLFTIINHTSTPVGKRHLLDRLLHPIIDKKELQRRYDMIERLKEPVHNPILFQYKSLLKEVYDIERLHRKITLQKLDPSFFINLHMSYKAIQKSFNKLEELENTDILYYLLPSNKIRNKFKKYQKEYQKIFNLDKMLKYNLQNIQESFFNKDIYPGVDKLQETLNSSFNWLNNKKKELSNFIEKDSNLIRLLNTEKSGYFLETTKKRGQILKKNCSEDLEYKTFQNKVKIYSKDIRKHSNSILSIQQKLGSIVRQKYLETCNILSSKYRILWLELTKFVSSLDVFVSCSEHALLHSYTKPILSKKETNSYIECRGLRHPIIEKIQTSIPYVPNDITIGKDSKKGMLLYGVNAVGKSSLMKSLGLNTILAQSGMFVAGDYFEFEPYHSLSTRISNNDNLFKGQSSFAVEMSELRNILHRADKYSLILGDELCNGTESISALSIVASGVVTLSERESSFIFATHLHRLANMDEIKELKNVSCYHMKIEYDDKQKKIIYHRKLEPGNGSPIYGLEVCRAMDMDSAFLVRANKIRQKIMGVSDSVLPMHNSHYNKAVWIDNCKVCHKKGEDVHHIKFQCDANKYNLIGAIHKNVDSNLVVLCKKCHDNVHHGNLVIEGYQMSTNGIELNFKYVKSKRVSKRKYSDEQIEKIISYKDITTLKKTKYLLKEKDNISISVSTIGKIWKGSY